MTPRSFADVLRGQRPERADPRLTSRVHADVRCELAAEPAGGLSEWAATFTGYASVFGTLIDAYVPTRIFPGAFVKTLQEQGDRVILLWNHDTGEPVGKPTRLREDEHGLHIEGRLSKTPKGEEVARLLRDKVVQEMSIGFDPLEWQMVDIGNGVVERHISELRLWEVSFVSLAANPEARIESVHRRPQTPAEREAVLAKVDALMAEVREAQLREVNDILARDRRQQCRHVDLLLAEHGLLPPGAVRR